MKTSNAKQRFTSAPRRALWIVFGVTVTLLAVCVGVWLYHALVRPESLFDSSVIAPYSQQTGDADKVDEISVVLEPSPTPEPDITDAHMVNILLLGTDMESKPYATNGGDFHTDAMIVVAVNFDKGTVDLISLPRDTFSRIPGYRGFYKLNAAINCGGGKTEQGFQTCCDASQWMLGGISVDYYFCIDMEAVAVVGDAIGGVDFDVDMSYYGAYGEYYKKGMQHLDGRGIYEYMRARTNATKNATDDGRMDRQKRMLLTMFRKMQEQGLLSTAPSILQAISDASYTNLSTQQVIALANFAYRIDPECIGMYTMSGSRSRVMSYVYTFTDQKKRVSLIRDVYGIDVEPITDCTHEVARWIQNTGLYALRCIQISDTLYQQLAAQPTSAARALLLEDLFSALDAARDCYRDAEAERTNAGNAELSAAVTALKERAQLAADAFGDMAEIDWDYKLTWYKDTNINEVTVDFR